jgi:hypothetical protein
MQPPGVFFFACAGGASGGLAFFAMGCFAMFSQTCVKYAADVYRLPNIPSYLEVSRVRRACKFDQNDNVLDYMHVDALVVDIAASFFPDAQAQC